MIEFKTFERAESTLETQGTVMSLVGKDGKLGLIPKNFKDATKRVVLILTKKNGTSAMISCSQAVSDGLRNKTIELGNVLGFEILEGESGIPFISLPAGGLIEVAVKNITVKDFVPSLTNYEELIAL